MKQLTGLDGSFLYMETPTSFGHVNGLAIYERPHDDFDPYAAVYRRYASKVGELEPMRRRVVEVPMGLDHPYWVMDPNFDLDFHIRHMSLAPPGRRDQLAEQVARIVGRPMDRTRPLWEVYVIEGLEDGSWALLTKYHHATIDGASGVIMMTMMNDLTPDAPPPGESLPWEPEAIPSDAELLRLAIGNLLRNPAKAMRTQLRIVRDFSAAAGITGRQLGGPAARRGDQVRGRAVRRAGRLASWLGRAADPVEPQHHGPPSLRHASRQGERPQAPEGGHRRHAERRRDGHRRRRPARLPDRARRPAGPAAAGDGAGVDPHRRRGGDVDEPGLRPGRRPADAPRRSDGAPGRVPGGDGSRQEAVRARASRGARRHPAVLVAGRRDVGDPDGGAAQAGRPHGATGQRDHLQRARPAPAAVPRRRPDADSTSRCRRSPRAWASTSPCTATSTSSSSG